MSSESKPPNTLAAPVAPAAGRGRSLAYPAQVIVALVGVVGLYWAKSYSYLLFHAVVELFGIVVAGCIFVIAWNGRALHGNFALTLLGVAYLAIGTLDLLHTLSFRGMGVFANLGADPATQLWIGSRYVLATSLLLVAVLPMRRAAFRGSEWVTLAIYGAVTAFVLAAVFRWQIFPDCFVDGVGLTPFKRRSEYACCGLILLAMVLLWRRREEMDRRLIVLMQLSMMTALLAGLAFTLYVDPSGLWNWTGHVLKLTSYFLAYEAIIVTAMERPLAVMFRDLKENDDALRAANRTAEAANAAKDRFLAALSHELRTPLAPVLLTLSSYESDERLPAQVRDDLRTARRNVALEAHLIDDLLDLNRVAAGKLTLRADPIDVATVVDDALRSCEADAVDKGIEIVTRLDALRGDVTVTGDAGRLQQVFWNLLKNAIKFTPKGGKVTVHAALASDARNENRPVVRVAFEDTGIGIAPDAIGRIFDAFEQADDEVTKRFGGLGLGLPIARAITAMHGGTLRATSEGSDRGAQLVVELPVSDAVVPRAVAASATPPVVASPGRAASTTVPGVVRHDGKRLLVVEDHPDTARLLARLLRAQGFTVTTANNAADARTAFEVGRANGEPFDLVLSDIGLPDETGYDLMRSIRTLDGATVGIAMSGFGMEEDLRRSREAGFAEHLVKPVGLDRLLEAIARNVRTSA